MSEFRKDPISDHWVIIAPNRALRPEELESGKGQRAPSRCPFCRGHEEDTPAAIAVYDSAGRMDRDGDWLVRVVPNKYPAVSGADGSCWSDGDFYQRGPGSGVHEVIIEAPDHIIRFGGLATEQAELVFRAYRDRLGDLKKEPGLAYVQIFKNCGSAAGASLEHSHSQLIATSVVPTQIQSELARSRAYFEQHGHCVFCDMLDREVLSGQRVVAASESFVAFCPFASQFPYETWILPRNHASCFEDTENRETGELARLVQDIVGRIEFALSDPAFNYLIHTAPFQLGPTEHYHWHLEIFPRLTKTAGFEWGAGDYINTVSPEDAAATLRSAPGPLDGMPRKSTEARD
jgi:UDPglucose--hexose-1-phosphate uridylyltransferase